jgi:hypothetical protein
VFRLPILPPNKRFQPTGKIAAILAFGRARTLSRSVVPVPALPAAEAWSLERTTPALKYWILLQSSLWIWNYDHDILLLQRSATYWSLQASFW